MGCRVTCGKATVFFVFIWCAVCTPYHISFDISAVQFFVTYLLTYKPIQMCKKPAYICLSIPMPQSNYLSAIYLSIIYVSCHIFVGPLLTPTLYLILLNYSLCTFFFLDFFYRSCTGHVLIFISQFKHCLLPCQAPVLHVTLKLLISFTFSLSSLKNPC